MALCRSGCTRDARAFPGAPTPKATRSFGSIPPRLRRSNRPGGIERSESRSTSIRDAAPKAQFRPPTPRERRLHPKNARTKYVFRFYCASVHKGAGKLDNGDMDGQATSLGALFRAANLFCKSAIRAKNDVHPTKLAQREPWPIIAHGGRFAAKKMRRLSTPIFFVVFQPQNKSGSRTPSSRHKARGLRSAFGPPRDAKQEQGPQNRAVNDGQLEVMLAGLHPPKMQQSENRHRINEFMQPP